MLYIVLSKSFPFTYHLDCRTDIDETIGRVIFFSEELQHKSNYNLKFDFDFFVGRN